MANNEVNELIQQEKEFGFARVYSVELLYREKPQIDRELIYANMQRYTGNLDRPNSEKTELGDIAVWEANEKTEHDLLHFFHLNYMVQYEEGELPSQTSLMDSKYQLSEKYNTALEQSWHWQEAEQTLQQCQHSLLLVDMMASGLEPQKRLELFTGALRAVLETVLCDALYFRESDKLVEPQAYLNAIENGEILYGAMNVRFYNVQGTGSERHECLMDTVGLAALGIPDLQCHFYDLTPNEVASFLMDLGYYLFNQGDIINDGETVGFTEDMRWRCEHQYSLAAPERVVIDLDPGDPHYAGRPGN